MKKSNVIGKTIKNEVNIIVDMKLFSYAGSKTKFKKQFHHILSKMDVKRVGTYIEAFAGSLASMWHIMEVINADKIVINDLNKRMINLYQQIKQNSTLVFTMLEKLEDKFQSMILDEIPRKGFVPKDMREIFDDNRNFYNDLRTYFNLHNLDAYNAAVMLFLLNHNFNGLYNENKKGGFNISFNWKAKKLSMNIMKTNLFNLSKFFNENNVVFESLDIDELVSKYNDHDTMIYLDPPYINTTIQYLQNRVGTKKKPSNNSFYDIETHIKLLDSCKKYKYVMYSNNHNKEFVNTLDGFINFSRTCNISNNKTNKSKLEILGYMVNEEASTISQEIPELKIENVTQVASTPVNNDIKVKKVVGGEDEYSIKIGTAFSGMACPEYSLKKLGINHTSIFAIENNKWARETIKRNNDVKQLFKDIRTVDEKKLDKVNLYVWGSPCQNFSMAATATGRLGLKGKTGQLFWDGYRILKATQPMYSIFENVKGLINHDGGNTFKVILKAFKKLGIYNIYHKVINPIDIGGNTNRERIFIILIRKDVDLFGGFQFPKNIKSTKCIKDCLIDSENHIYIDKKDYIPFPRSVEKQRGKLKKDFLLTNTKRQSDQRVFNINYPAPTILRNGLVNINDGKGVRKMTIPELKKTQGFDDIDMKMDHLSDTQIKSQLGNTMEVETMKQLLSEIVRLDKLYIQSKINNTDYQPTITKSVA